MKLAEEELRARNQLYQATDISNRLGGSTAAPPRIAKQGCFLQEQLQDGG